MNKCLFCYKGFHTNKSRARHATYCKLNPDRKEVWNKGLSKITDDRIKSYSNKVSLSLKGKSLGKCLDPEKELLRRLKISETMKLNPKAGGLRKGSGRGKKGKYKGFYCDSTWELAFVIYHLDEEIDIKRNTSGFRYEYKSKERTYYPDFIVNNIYYEIKGRRNYMDLDEQTKLKVDTFSEVVILYESEMKFYLDYVRVKYGIDFKYLYE